MRYIKPFGLCLTVALAVCAIATAAASAEAPEFKFSGENDRFSSKGGALKLETTKGEVVKCERATATGAVEPIGGHNTVKDFLPVFKGCTATILGKVYKCKSSGASEEEIKGFGLQAELGWLSKSKEEVGILLGPETGRANNSNDLFAEFECTRVSETVTVKIKGSVIGKITPVNAAVGPAETTKFFEVKFTKGEAKGEAGVKSFEGEAENKLETASSITEKEGKGFVGSAIEDSLELFPEVTTTIRAPIVTVIHTGAGAGGKPTICLFAAKFEKCEGMEVTNVSTVEEEVTVSAIEGPASASRFRFTLNGCSGKKLPAGTSCTVVVEAFSEPIAGENWLSNGYRAEVKQVAAPKEIGGAVISLFMCSRPMGCPT